MLNALAISIGVLAGVAMWLVLGPIGGALQIWVVFIAWGCFYHCGGKTAGLQSTITGMAFGALLGAIALMLITGVPMAASIGLPLWAGIVVAPIVAVCVLAAQIPSFAVIPATVYGFASLAGLALLTSKASVEALTAPSLANPLVVIWLSLILGAAFGYAFEMIGIALAKPADAPAVA